MSAGEPIRKQVPSIRNYNWNSPPRRYLPFRHEGLGAPVVIPCSINLNLHCVSSLHVDLGNLLALVIMIREISSHNGMYIIFVAAHLFWKRSLMPSQTTVESSHDHGQIQVYYIQNSLMLKSRCWYRRGPEKGAPGGVDWPLSAWQGRQEDHRRLFKL